MKLTERQILSPALRTVLYWAICVASIYCGEQLHICNQFGAKGLDSWYIYLSEAMLFASPALFLKGRARIASAIIASIFLLWLWADILYCRYSGISLRASLIFSPASYNVIVLKCIPDLFRKHDLLYLIAIAADWAAYIHLRPYRCPALKSAARIAAAVIPAAGYCFFTILNVTTIFKEDFRFYGWENLAISGTSNVFRQGGSLLYFGYDTYCTKVSRHKELSPSEASEIKQFFDNKKPYECDSTFMSNREKNLIFIIVESLNSWAISLKHNGRSVTPVLDSLIQSEGTISCLKVIPQVSMGFSADGQFIYNTGLLPLKNTVAAVTFNENKVIGLPRALEVRSAEEFICEDSRAWYHNQTSRQYGYDALHDCLGQEPNYDASLFKASAERIGGMTTSQPFLAEITTMTSHFPYEQAQSDTIAPWLNDYGTSDIQRHYVKAINLFDTALGKFLREQLPEEIRDSSVIAIASDHHIGLTGENCYDITPIAFIAANTGHTEEIAGPVGQIDIYPTLLQIMGRDRQRCHWLGESILTYGNSSAADIAGRLHGKSDASSDSLKIQAWHISELIIRSGLTAEF